jgi:hypothetical protein
VIRTKKRIGGTQLHSHYRMFLSVPSASGVHGFCGQFSSEDEAIERDSPKNKICVVSSPNTNKAVVGMKELDRHLSSTRTLAKTKGLIKRKKQIRQELRNKVHGLSGNDDLVEDVAKSFRADTPAIHVANLLAEFSALQQAGNKLRVTERMMAIPTRKKRTDFKSYYLPQLRRDLLKLQKWHDAREFLGPFIRDQTTDGLVLVNEGKGIDLSITGTTRILRKAYIVHLLLPVCTGL